MRHMVPICLFLADLEVFSYILCLIILICVELKFKIYEFNPIIESNSKKESDFFVNHK
jgi:hypothetical protein